MTRPAATPRSVAIDTLVASARSGTETAAAELVAEALTTCRKLDPKPPLSAVALEGVFLLCVANARKDTGTAAAAVFSSAVLHVFRHEDLADVWDESFTGIAMVDGTSGPSTAPRPLFGRVR